MPSYDQEKCKCLKTKGRDVNQYNCFFHNERVILHCACEEDDWDFIVWLVDHWGADIHLLTFRWKNNALRFSRSLRVVKFLIWRGCDPFHRNSSGELSADIRHGFGVNSYVKIEPLRIKILIGIDKSSLHKDLWREVAGWMFPRL